MNLNQTNIAFTDSTNSGRSVSRIESVLITKAERDFQLLKKRWYDE